jgi:hypothetical protein
MRWGPRPTSVWTIRSGVGDRHPKRDTLRLSRRAPPPPRPALRNRRAVEPLLGILVAARQRREPHLRSPGVAVVPAPLRVGLLVHGPSLRRDD